MNEQSDGAPERQVVLHPRTAAARQLGRARARGGFVRGHAVSDEGLEDLVSAQRRLALQSLLCLIVPLLLLPLVLSLFPALPAARVGPLPPLGWLLLGPLVFPLFVVLGRRHERRANDVEQQWMERQT